MTKKSGFVRARINGEIKELSNEINLDKNKWHTIDIVIDRLIMNESIDKDRLTNSVETSLKLSNGLTVIAIDSKTELKFSENFSCPDCNISLEEIEPRNFSFNSPKGACKTCSGIGHSLKADPSLIIPNQEISIMRFFRTLNLCIWL